MIPAEIVHSLPTTVVLLLALVSIAGGASFCLRRGSLLGAVLIAAGWIGFLWFFYRDPSLTWVIVSSLGPVGIFVGYVSGRRRGMGWIR